MKKLGKIKWFNRSKGFGFIERDDGEGELLANNSSIKEDDLSSITDGQTVEFEITEGTNGPEATNITLCGPHGSGDGDDE